MKKENTPKRLLLLIFFLHISFINSQQIYKTSFIATDLELEYKINKKITSSIEYQIRYDLTNDIVKWFVYDLGLSAKINKHFKASSKYRLKNRNDAMQHSIYTNFYYQTKKNPLNVKYRFRFNKKIRFGKNSNSLYKKSDEEHLRNRMLVEYKITKKFTPYFGAELFYLINNKKYRNGFDIFRYYTGLEYKITSKHYLEFTWIYEEVFNFGQREKENLYKLTVTIKLN